ncbi:unnamed protein product [Citrullus colocynthis]|uniref:Secreted protein n=1 Tax=Citrullus colocynthis TaxID=252529 RepID=A0ABP0YQA0_9ROSI
MLIALGFFAILSSAADCQHRNSQRRFSLPAPPSVSFAPVSLTSHTTVDSLFHRRHRFLHTHMHIQMRLW